MSYFLFGKAAELLQPYADSLAVGRRRSRVELILQSKDFLEDAENRQLRDPIVKNWLESIKDVYYDVIDVLEEMKLQEEKKVRFLGIPLSFVNPFRQYMVRNNMQGIIDKFEDLTKKSKTLKLNSRSEQAQSNWISTRVSSTFLGVKVSIYGRDDETRTLISKVLSEDSQAQDIQFISIVGVAAIGKTTLAQLVYNNEQVRRYFDLKGWISVTQEFDLLGIARTILECFSRTVIDDDDLESVFHRVAQIIRSKRYLLVLDDVWNEDDSKWKQLAQALNCGASGSTVLITTRSESVARTSGSTCIERPKVLSDQDCWYIFRDFAIDGRNLGDIFEEIGREIAKKSRGLPLIAKTLGSLLRFSTSIDQWKAVLTANVWDLPLSESDLNSSLMLTYSIMPSELRQCLLYCSIFPKNHYIDVDKLIKLWMAQSFVASDRDEMEREGWGCFQRLLDLSIFQEFKRDDNGNFKCKMEGAMGDLVQFLAQNECHIMLLDYQTELGVNHIPTKPRHCALNVAPQASLPAFIAYAEKLHTLMIFSEYSSTDPTILASLLSPMRRLRALDLSSCSIKELPLKVGELLQLRYLDLSFNRDLKKLPQGICNLFNLQTLNLNGCDSLRKLPKGIGKLTKLRHLEILWTTSLSYLPKGVASLTSLRTLSRFFGSSGVGSRACNLGDLEKLNYIQGCITIDGLGSETGDSEAVKAGLKNKRDLLGLELWFSVLGSERSDQVVLEALEAPPGLQCLGIFYYRGMFFPDWLTALENLTHLMLADCSKCNALPPLGKLPSLESLEIKNVAHVKKVDSEFLGIGLDGADGSEEGPSSIVAFPNLKKLRFQQLDDWEEWVGISGNGGYANIMPSLSSLSIVSCAKIKAVPDYIKCKENLETDIKECPFLEENPEDRG